MASLQVGAGRGFRPPDIDGTRPAVWARHYKGARGAHLESKERREGEITMSKLKMFLAGSTLAATLAASPLASAAVYTAPVTAMGVTHCSAGSPAGWKVIPWIKFAGFYWIVDDWIDFINNGPSGTSDFYQSTLTPMFISVAQQSFQTGAQVTGGCLSGSGMSNCTNINWCGDGRTYWNIDSLSLGN
jgi:hypothetical protein